MGLTHPEAEIITDPKKVAQAKELYEASLASLQAAQESVERRLSALRLAERTPVGHEYYGTMNKGDNFAGKESCKILPAKDLSGKTVPEKVEIFSKESSN